MSKKEINALIHFAYDSIQKVVGSIEREPSIVLSQQYIVLGKTVESEIDNIYARLDDDQKKAYHTILDSHKSSISEKISPEQKKIFLIYYKLQALGKIN